MSRKACMQQNSTYTRLLICHVLNTEGLRIGINHQASLHVNAPVKALAGVFPLLR